MEDDVGGARRSKGERAFLLEPLPRRVGPGRIERGYLRRIDELERDTSEGLARLRRAELELARTRGELDAAARVERGLQRLTDRLEERIETAAQREKRLILALGALQKENEQLRGQLALGAASRPQALPGPAAARPAGRARTRPARPGGLLARLFGGAPGA